MKEKKDDLEYEQFETDNNNKKPKRNQSSSYILYFLLIPIIISILFFGFKYFNFNNDMTIIKPNEKNTILCPFDNGIRVMQKFKRGVYGASNAPEIIYKYLFNKTPKNIIPVKQYNTFKNEDSYKGHEEITKYISKFDPPFLVLGGDHSITYPIVKGLNENLKNKKLGLIYFDAHYDLRPLEGENQDILSSGNSFYRIIKNKEINGENIVVIGIKKGISDIFKIMDDFAHKNKMTVFYSDEINESNYKKIMEKAIEIASKGTDGIYLSFDVDLIDAKYVPGCSCPAIENGFNLNWAKDMVAMGKFIAADIVETSNREKNYKGEEDKDGNKKLDISAKTDVEIISNMNFIKIK